MKTWMKWTCAFAAIATVAPVATAQDVPTRAAKTPVDGSSGNALQAVQQGAENAVDRIQRGVQNVERRVSQAGQRIANPGNNVRGQQTADGPAIKNPNRDFRSQNDQLQNGQTQNGQVRNNQYRGNQGQQGQVQGSDQNNGRWAPGQNQQGQQYSNQSSGKPISSVLLEGMKKSTEFEVKLAKMVSERSDNDQLTKLADQMIREHQNTLQDIEKASAVSQNGDQNSMVARVPDAMCNLMERACKTEQESVVAMLEKTNGQDFTMAFLGQQILSHMQSIAHLEAISQGDQAVSSSVRDLASQLLQRERAHLEEAKKLANQFENDKNS